MAFYGYARLVDEIGDSYPGDRLAALDWMEAETTSALADPDAIGLAPLVAEAAQSVRALSLDPAPLYKLIAANRQDQAVATYQTFEDLLEYCALSADPVGHLVLGAFGAVSPENLRHSDAICSGLQLVEHWQDVAEDAAAGRIYLPQEDLARFGVSPEELGAGAPASRRLRALMVFEAARARRMLDEGAPLIAALGGRLRWAVAGFWAGGQASLDALADHGFDPLTGRAAPSRHRIAVRMLAARGQARLSREAA
jgi:squalene synthase HpnC